MAPSPPAVTDGSKTWAPSHLFDNTNPEIWDKVHSHLKANEFRAAIASAFELPQGDSFTYHATASVNLAQAEAAIRAGRANGLHDWYVEQAEVHSEEANAKTAIAGQPGLQTAGYPPVTDIQAYIALFDPTKATANSLKSLSANAKKGSLRATVAGYLQAKRHLDPSITVPKFKPSATAKAHQNPSFDFWAYSCVALEYAGPNAHTALVKTSHHILPVYMHHFGCVVPSWESLQIISKSAHGRSVLDMGSGNGYWTLMLRRLGVPAVAVDSGQSRWRTTWIADTAVTDGVQYLRKRSGCPDMVLLLVYPIVGGDFTRRVLDAYAGDVICVAGTQNGNGYTGFKDMMIDEYMSREKEGWRKVAQVPLPSFAGKDDALLVFRKEKVGESNG
ncbi:hypothetical protein PV04_08523 [Phialophora macrospora]|uniref:Uncharacterized protein n=1 Tax=Phialophora macrospora TaxID=1851006 RepID=A0A0D2F6I7_9EURO|nr:hypothetical protein PV04_08523 [Phialophora macrospora]